MVPVVSEPAVSVAVDVAVSVAPEVTDSIAPEVTPEPAVAAVSDTAVDASGVAISANAVEQTRARAASARRRIRSKAPM